MPTPWKPSSRSNFIPANIVVDYSGTSPIILRAKQMGGSSHTSMNEPALEIKRRKPPTLVHVARLAGVGIGTASRVLNGDGYVSEKTAERVRSVIAELQYKPNEVARSLKVRRSGAIGIVVPDLSDPFIATCVQAAQTVVRSRGGISVLTFSEGKSEMEAQEVDYLVRRQIDGLLLISAGGKSDHLTSNMLNETPLVCFDQPIAGRKVDAVLVKNKAGTIEGVEHLLGHGHTRIFCLGVNKHLYTIATRIEAYEEVMKRAGLPGTVATVDPTPEAICEQVKEWMSLPYPPTAIFSLNGLTSSHLLRALADLKVSVPDRIAIVGFDDLQLADLLAVPLTVVRQPAALLGSRAAALLYERIAAKTELVPKRVTLDVELIIRRSCGCKETASS